MLPRTKSLLEELDGFLSHRDKESMIESRATHVIQSACNLIETIRDNYDPEVAIELERRLINSIKAQDASKFTRGIRKVKNEDQ